MGYILNLAVQRVLFHNLITTKELELYNKLEQKGELKDIEKVKRKFQLLSVLSKFHNICNRR